MFHCGHLLGLYNTLTASAFCETSGFFVTSISLWLRNIISVPSPHNEGETMSGETMLLGLSIQPHVQLFTSFWQCCWVKPIPSEARVGADHRMLVTTDHNSSQPTSISTHFITKHKSRNITIVSCNHFMVQILLPTQLQTHQSEEFTKHTYTALIVWSCKGQLSVGPACLPKCVSTRHFPFVASYNVMQCNDDLSLFTTGYRQKVTIWQCCYL